MYPHRIRLRGPWDCEPLAREDAGPPAAPVRVTMPCPWRDSGLAGAAGRVRCRRRFGYPGRIDADERVWLTFAGFSATADVALNGHALGRRTRADCPCAFDVTSLLQPRNELVVTIESSTDDDGLWGEVALEIRRTAYLRGIEVSLGRDAAGARLRVTGQVVGHSAGPLDLYALVGDRTAAYAQVQAAETGAPFELVAEPLDPELAPAGAPVVRVELVEGAVVWYRVEMPATA